jgi:RNA polymerase sigma-70 factor, ECF subfamily
MRRPDARPAITPPTDHELVRRIQCGDRAAFDAIVLRHQGKTFRLALRILKNREDAQDATQDTFEGVFAHIDQFKFDSAFTTWLYRITLNRAFQIKRGRAIRPEGYSSSLDEPTEDLKRKVRAMADKGLSPEELVLQDERAAKIRKALTTLSKNRRMAIVLRDIWEFKYEEMADMLGITRLALKCRVFQARKVLEPKLAPLARSS